MVISIIICAFKEPDGVRRAINSFQLQPHDEILVVAPDKETEEVCKEFESKKIRYIKDEGVGKPAALNLAFREAKGDILILTDGDVYPNVYAVGQFIKVFDIFTDPEIGAVSGRPVSLSPTTTMLGY